MDNKGMSPMAATALLVIFALVLGVVTMSFGKNYVDKLNIRENINVKQIGPSGTTTTVIDTKDPLAQLMIEYQTGKISKEEFLARQKQLTGG